MKTYIIVYSYRKLQLSEDKEISVFVLKKIVTQNWNTNKQKKNLTTKPTEIWNIFAFNKQYVKIIIVIIFKYLNLAHSEIIGIKKAIIFFKLK